MIIININVLEKSLKHKTDTWCSQQILLALTQVYTAHIFIIDFIDREMYISTNKIEFVAYANDVDMNRLATDGQSLVWIRHGNGHDIDNWKPPLIR